MTHLCPVCSLQVRQGQPQVRVYDQRWHRDCWPGLVLSRFLCRPPKLVSDVTRMVRPRRVKVLLVVSTLCTGPKSVPSGRRVTEIVAAGNGAFAATSEDLSVAKRIIPGSIAALTLALLASMVIAPPAS